MMYKLYHCNHPDIAYREGQGPILHLQADLNAVIDWAETNAIRWAFSRSNAGARYTLFYSKKADLNKIDWNAVEATDFRDRMVQERKQAELLLYESFPWRLVEKIGVLDETIMAQVNRDLQQSSHKPIVSIEQSWYYESKRI